MVPAGVGVKSLEILLDPQDVARRVAERFVRAATLASAIRKRFTVALAGGASPRDAYQLLATREFARQIDWDRVHVWWGDERCVSPEDPQSNYRMATESLINKVPIPLKQVHRIRGEDPPVGAAAAYEDSLREQFGFNDRLDLILLGLGKEGHTASLFPGQAAVSEKVRWVRSLHQLGESVKEEQPTSEARRGDHLAHMRLGRVGLIERPALRRESRRL